MRYLVVVKANPESEAGVMPSQELMLAMAALNEKMLAAGVLVDGTGLERSAKGVRVHFSGDKRSIEHGPFANTEELISGYWVLKVNSIDEAIQWAKQIPFTDGHVEIRRFLELEDFEPGEAIDRERELSKVLEAQRAQS